MLKDRLYRITAADWQENASLVTLKLNKDHPIFAGHFPGQPVLPGACILDMVREILSAALRSKYRLKEASILKFIAPVNPGTQPELTLTLNYKSVSAGLQVMASLSANGVIFFKMQGVYRTA